jgi:hypothetical protein
MRKIEGKDRRKILMKDITVHRLRECDQCGSTTLTAEFMRSKHNGNKADRCPECIVGRGASGTYTVAWSRPIDGPYCNRAADLAGAVVRRRHCTNGCKNKKGKPFRWTTWEVWASGYAFKDITICPCGGRMKVAGRWNPYLERLQ